MINQHELFVSARDAEALAAMLGAHRRADPFESDASDELADLLMEARLVPTETLPSDRVAMNSIVTYVEEPSGVRRTVTLAYPQEADATNGRISVLSPVGRALIGRRRGAVVAPAMPNGRELTIRILDATRNREPLRVAV
ncbi:MAG: GreA/GreB family elongation factor [Burkholderiales bacterium]